MTAPTKEQVEEWRLAADRYASDAPGAQDAEIWVRTRDTQLAALAFAAGQSSGAGSGAELVREVEEAESVGVRGIVCNRLWPRLRATLIAGDEAREVADSATKGVYSETMLRAAEAIGTMRASKIQVGTLEAELAEAREDAEEAFDLLETMYRLWENGVDCYLDPEDQTGYLGKAVDLDDVTERKIADLLNEHRPNRRSMTSTERGEAVMRDLLTQEECSRLRSEPGSFNEMLQAAARLGAERERERCAERISCQLPMMPTAPPGSYARGYDSGMRAALAAIRCGEEG